MSDMSGAERTVAYFLTKNGIKWEYEKPVSVRDNGNRMRTFYPDFYLTELHLYIEVCGAPRNEDYSRRDEIYKKNNVPILFIETFKEREKWQYFLKQSIIEFAEKRHKKWTELNLVGNNDFRNNKDITKKQDVGDKPVNKNNSSSDYKNYSKSEHSNSSNKSYSGSYYSHVKTNTVNIPDYLKNQTVLGTIAMAIGIFLIFAALGAALMGDAVCFVTGLIGVVLTILGYKILSVRFSIWYKKKSKEFNKWVRK